MEAIFHESHPESVHLTSGGRPHFPAEPHPGIGMRGTRAKLQSLGFFCLVFLLYLGMTTE